MFTCDQCGLCCKCLSNNAMYSDLDRGDGVCKYLKDNLCTIYNSRPVKCNTELFYEKYLCNSISKDEYEKLNKYSCLELKNKRRI